MPSSSVRINESVSGKCGYVVTYKDIQPQVRLNDLSTVPGVFSL